MHSRTPKTTKGRLPLLQKSPTNASKVSKAVPAQKFRNYVHPIVIDNPLEATSVLKEFAAICEAKIMGKMLPGNKLRFSPKHQIITVRSRNSLLKRNLNRSPSSYQSNNYLKMSSEASLPVRIPKTSNLN
ncbi:hypothetical protein AVEN_78041-1 [Araneus ventricosus]|uniref:Uncharacterized protein n=1 Tax=Araneus ventricosus TaxID=182803 RepID=A0A4Y2FT92_ARAVE|nr:hypothetical protein AVEN_78041-1 [Araneus ventricosus]